MTQSLKIECIVGDISQSGEVASTLVTKELLDSSLASKASLVNGKIPDAQLPAFIATAFQSVNQSISSLTTTVGNNLQIAKDYAEAYTDEALSTKADLVNGKIPFLQLPNLAQDQSIVDALAQVESNARQAMVTRTDELQVSKADLGEDGKLTSTQMPNYRSIPDLEAVVDNIYEQKADKGESYTKAETMSSAQIESAVDAVKNVSHNSLVGKDAPNAHLASSILDASGQNQQVLNEKFKTVDLKADKTYVDTALSSFQNGAIKAYPTLALANADIANIALDTKVSVLSETDGGDYYKATAGATSLTKSAYDPIVQAKNYTDGEVSSLGISSANNPSISIAIVDDEDNRTWLEADGAGKPTQYAAECIIEAINFNDVAIPSKFKSSYQPKEVQITSGPDIVCWGDSMTAGAGGNGTTYPSALKTLLQAAGGTANVNNMGVGGETSVTICARQGGNPFLINVTGGIIPANASPVTVTLEQIDGQTVRPLLQGSTTWTGVLDGIAGVLNLVEPSGSGYGWQADNYYTFARTTAGTQITFDRPKPFYLDVAVPRLGDIHIIWIGQNGPSTARAISDAKAMIQHMQALDKRYLVVSKPTSTDADDSLFFAEFGRRFVAARKYLVQYGLQDAGITPTAQDNSDIANGVVPTSLRVDSVHWTAQGYTILANILFNRIKELGWI